MPPLKGTNASKLLASQRYHPLQAVRDAVGAVYELPKKRSGPYPPPSSKHRPLTEGNTTKVMEEIPTSRRYYDQTTAGQQPKKKEGP